MTTLFELKRIRKSRLIWLVVVIALLLSLVNSWYSTSSASLKPGDNSIVRTYGSIMLLDPYPTNTNYSTLPGWKKYLTESEKSDYLRSNSFAYALLAIEEDGHTIGDDHRADLEFGLFFSEYAKEHEYLEEYFLQPTGLYTLRHGSTILFGLIPFLIFFAFGVWSISENYERGSLAYHRVLPIKWSRHVLSKWLSLVLLAVGYVALVSLFSLLISSARGFPIGRLDYPLRIFGEPEHYLTSLTFLLRLSGLFLVRMIFDISIGLLLGNVMRRTSGAVLAGALVLAILFIGVSYLPGSQVNGIPFYVDAFRLFQGKRELILNPITNQVLGFDSVEPIGVSLSLAVMGLISLLAISGATLASYLDRLGNAWQQRRNSRSLSSRRPLVFEWK